MNSRIRRESRSFRPSQERLESRLVMSGNTSVPAEVQAMLAGAVGHNAARPNTPVLPLFQAFAIASFIDPSVSITNGKQVIVRQKDYVAPYATLNAKNGEIAIGSSSTIQDNAELIANPSHLSGKSGIFIGYNVVVGNGAVIEGPAAIGSIGGVATSIGPNALIDGAIIQPGAFVGALARVGPGVTVPTGYRVLPGANVTTDAEASNPSLGMVAKVTSSDGFASAATKLIADSVALALGYATLYQGNSATGGPVSAGPIPAPIASAGSTIFFGALNTVLGASSEPGSKNVTFEPATGTPTFLAADGTQQPIAINLAYQFPARVIGAVSALDQGSGAFQLALGKGDSIRADEGQPIKIGSIAGLGNGVSIHSPLGGVQGTTTTTVVTTVTDTVTKVTTTTTTASTATSVGAPTATAGTTTATTTGINTAGHATTGTTVTTIATKSTNIGAITIGQSFQAGNDVVILGSPTANTSIGDDVAIGNGTVISGSTIPSGATIGNRAYIVNSAIPPLTVVPDGEIIINNVIVGTVQW